MATVNKGDPVDAVLKHFETHGNIQGLDDDLMAALDRDATPADMKRLRPVFQASYDMVEEVIALAEEHGLPDIHEARQANQNYRAWFLSKGEE